MTQLLIAALAGFWIIKLIRTWVDAPFWVWVLAQVMVGVLALLPWQSHHVGWTSPLAVAGIISFLQHTENFLITKADEALAAVMRRR